MVSAFEYLRSRDRSELTMRLKELLCFLFVKFCLVSLILIKGGWSLVLVYWYCWRSGTCFDCVYYGAVGRVLKVS